MPGTLSATVIPVAAPQNVAANFTGSGALDVAAMTPIIAMGAVFAGSGALTAAMISRASLGAALAGAGALTATSSQKYVSAPNLSAVGALSATVVSAGAHYSDDFNRADATTLGANWTQRNTVSTNQFQIVGNAARAATTDFSLMSVSTWVQPMRSNHHRVNAVLKNFGFADIMVIFVRSNATTQVALMASGIGFALPLSIFTSTSYENAWGTGTQQVNLGVFVADGDTISLEANSSRYTAYQNGVALGYWDDTGAIAPVDSSHREVGIAYTNYSGTTLAGGFDSWSADDVGLITRANLAGTGTLSATVTKWFEQSTETNTPRSNAAIPANLPTGVWVTLIGAGGGGGSGRKVASTSGGGGGAAGGGGFVARTFIPKASLGPTYSVTVATTAAAGGASQTTSSSNGNPGTAGAAATFSSGATNISVGGGGAGAGGLTTAASGGAGGTVSGATGVNGTAGGAGQITAGTAGTNSGSSNSSAAGGGGGGGIGSAGAKSGGGTGGSANGQAGGTPGNNTTTPNAAGGGTITAGVAGSGGGGGGAGSSTAGAGGAGNGYGSGGGGGAGHTGNSGAGGTGGLGYSLLEWV